MLPERRRAGAARGPRWGGRAGPAHAAAGHPPAPGRDEPRARGGPAAASDARAPAPAAADRAAAVSPLRRPDDARPRVVTQRVDPGESFDMSWVPERAGRWVFHCHMLVHMSQPAPREGATAATHAHDASNTESAGMGGLVLGITVLPPDKVVP